MIIEKIGNYHVLFSMPVNGVKYYFISKSNERGFRTVYPTRKDAVSVFVWLEGFEKNKEEKYNEKKCK